MIYTFTTKKEQLRSGRFQTGTGPLKVLILGSCRTMQFLNYLDQWNAMSGNGMTIYYINPFDWHWNENDDLVDLQAAVLALENDRRVLDVIESADVFIHEYFGNYLMFNTDRSAEKNIYQFGMKAVTDISIPNFHDHFILYNDFTAFGNAPDNWSQLGRESVDKFCHICTLTSFPEMGDYFRENWTTTRFFYTPNHTSKHFTYWLMQKMNEMYLKLPMTNEFWQKVRDDDMFASPCTQVHQKDIEAYGLTWS